MPTNLVVFDVLDTKPCWSAKYTTIKTIKPSKIDINTAIIIRPCIQYTAGAASMHANVLFTLP